MTNIFKKNKKKTSYQLLRIASKITELDRKTRTYGTDIPLYEAEIHMIKAIMESDGISVTGLAEQLEVTKGAVSQIIGKLDRKGMIVKEKDETNLSRLVLRLSDKGETAYLQHKKLHQEFDYLVENILSSKANSEKKFLTKFLTELEADIDQFEDRYV